MPDQVLVADRESLLATPAIQIIHKHPDSSHATRKDLDPEEFISESYPVLLADKVLNFLPKAPQGAEQTDIDTPASSQGSTLAIMVQRTSQVCSPTDPFITPTRPQATYATIGTFRTAFTSRTITPGGTLFSPLPDQDKTPSKVTFPSPQASHAIPSTLFSPPKPPALNRYERATTQFATAPHGRGRGRGRGRRRASPPSPPPLIEFETAFRSIHGNSPKQTLILRHRSEVEPLRDVFVWSQKCVEEGKLVSIEGWLTKFRYMERVRDIMEVCFMFGHTKMRQECERTIQNFERVGEKLMLGSVEMIAMASDEEDGMMEVQEITKNDREEVESLQDAEAG